MNSNGFPDRSSLKKTHQQRLSIIIPTLNEIDYLPGLLDAIDRQTRIPDEIIIADAGSIDGTAQLASARGARVVQGGLPAVGRNAGARAAEGDILLFLDADVRPQADFIACALDEFERKGYDIATCFIAALDENPLDQLLSTGTNLYFRIVQSISPHAPGFCILSKRIAHEKLGGFDESLVISEDIDYARRASQTGYFGFLDTTRIPVSMRRVGKEGLIGLGLKYTWCEMYALAGKPVRYMPFKYEFGAFTPPRLNAKLNSGYGEAVSNRWKKFRLPLQSAGSKIYRQFLQ